MRLFAAVNLPGEVKEKIASAQNALKRVPADVRWVNCGMFHLTLKFLGEVPEEGKGGVVAAIEKAVDGSGPFVVSFCGLGFFPEPRRARIVWAGVREGADELRRLAAAIDQEFSCLGFPEEARDFKCHVTLGRVRSRQNQEALVKKVESMGDMTLGSFTVKAVDLMQSVLTPRGAQYTCLKSISV